MVKSAAQRAKVLPKLRPSSVPGITQLRPAQRFIYEKPIQIGSTSVVTKAIDITTKQAVALKRSKLKKHKGQVNREYQILNSLPPHPNVMSVHGTAFDSDNDSTYLIMELCDGGDLVNVISANCDGMGMGKFMSYALQLTSAISHLHSNGVVHRDMKADNVCLSRSNGKAKLVDFGEAQFVSDQVGQFRVGTLPYIAPELLARAEYVDEQEVHNTASSVSGEYDIRSVINETKLDLTKCDIWSLGITFYCMLTCRFPMYSASVKDDLFMQWANGGSLGHHSAWETMPVFSKILLSNMLNVDENKRWDINKVYEFLVTSLIAQGA
eukprot:CFRG7951T1